MQLLQCGMIQTVAFFKSTWDVIVNRRMTQLQAMPQDTRAGNAIDVVVAVNRNAAFVLNRPDNQIGGGVNSGKLRGIMQVAEFRVQKFASRISLRKPPRDQHLSQQRRNPQLST